MLNCRLLPGSHSALFVLLLLFAGTPVLAQIDYPPFPNSGISFVGDAGFDGGNIRLIRTLPPSSPVAAAAWYNDTQRIADGFVTTFSFRIVNAGGLNGGGDGLVFVIHGGGTGTIGSNGGGIGYAGIPNSLAVELDTYRNEDLGDPDNHQVSIHPNGLNSEAASIGSASIPNIQDGADHAVRIEYDGPSNAHQMRVFVDNMSTPVLTVTANLPVILPNLGSEARVGFTAGAASAYENHDILRWSFFPSPNVRDVSFRQIAPASGRTVPIDDNPLVGDVPGTDYGLRLFPDHDFPTDTADRSTVSVDANIGVHLANKMVYFRFFDMDDPSVHSDIDPGQAGNDNRDSSAQMRIPPGREADCVVNAETNTIGCPTDPTGMASVNLTVSKQPGDNFEVAASTNPTEVNAVHFDPADGLELLSAAGTRLNSMCGSADKACRSRLLTVWRRLHIETDKMPPVDINHVDDQLVPGPVATPTPLPGVTIPAGKTLELDLQGELEAGRFVAGRIHVGNNWMPILDNTANSVTVKNPTLDDILVPYSNTFQLYDDDDFNNNNGADVIGDEGEAIPPPDRTLIQEFDNPAQNVLALAYIRPVYDINNVGDGLSPQFEANLDGFTGGPGLDSIITFDNRATEDDPQFWTVYLLNAYQGLSSSDGDGLTPGDGFAPPMNERAEVGATYNGPASSLASFIFVEPAGTKECDPSQHKAAYACDVSVITAREVARALGAAEQDGGLLSLESTVLSDQSLRKIRQNTYP